MKNKFGLVLVLLLTACSSLSYGELRTLRQLEVNGITVDRASYYYEKPASPLAPGLLNVFPCFGNFYLGVGKGAESAHLIYGFFNLWFWPISVL